LIYSAIASATVRLFITVATAARERCRTEEATYWLDLHTLYPGVADLLERHAGAVAVVTAKDAESVWTILRRRGLEHTVAEVIGECSRKDEAVLDLCKRHGGTARGITFIDDNLTNVRQVAAIGAVTRWATWGYHTPADAAVAADLGVRPLALSEVPALTA